MSSPVVPLNNARLRETPFPSAAYSKLPHINDMHDAAANNARAHAPSPFPEAPADSVLTINGTPVEEGTKSHVIISHALKLVDFVY